MPRKKMEVGNRKTEVQTRSCTGFRLLATVVLLQVWRFVQETEIPHKNILSRATLDVKDELGGIGVLIWSGSPAHSPESHVFLDRDGVLNRDRPDYVKRWDEFEFYPDALEALRWLREHGVGVVLVSNQSGLGRGIITWEDFWEMFERMLAVIRKERGDLMAAFYCPHRPDAGCSCRKPSPGMILKAATTFDIPVDRCFMIGDRWKDVEAIARAGGRGVLLRREDAAPSSEPRSSPDRTVATYATLLEAVKALPWTSLHPS